MSMQNHSVTELPNKMPKRLSYSTTFKLQVVDFGETNGNRSAARRFGVDKSIVWPIDICVCFVSCVLLIFL